MLALVLSLASCSRAEPGVSALTSTTSADAGTAAPRALLSAHNACVGTPNNVVIHAIIPTDFTFDGDTAKALGHSKKTTRELWSISCSRKTGDCQGTTIDLEKVDQGAPLRFLDVNAVEGAKLASEAAGVFVIRFGPWRTFRVDTKAKRILYTETGPTTEGHGEVACSDSLQ